MTGRCDVGWKSWKQFSWTTCMEINVKIEDRRASLLWRVVRVLLLVGLVAYSWKSGYDLGGQDMLNQFLVEPGHSSEKDLFTSL